MKWLYHICFGITLGVIAGFAAGCIRYAFRRKDYSKEYVESAKKFIGKAATVLKYLTFLMLVLGLIWCVYFLVLGIVIPGQSDYANNMAELIVSVLTVISIIFAFVEFLKPKDKKK